MGYTTKFESERPLAVPRLLSGVPNQYPLIISIPSPRRLNVNMGTTLQPRTISRITRAINELRGLGLPNDPSQRPDYHYFRELSKPGNEVKTDISTVSRARMLKSNAEVLASEKRDRDANTLRAQERILRKINVTPNRNGFTYSESDEHIDIKTSFNSDSTLEKRYGMGRAYTTDNKKEPNKTYTYEEDTFFVKPY